MDFRLYVRAKDGSVRLQLQDITSVKIVEKLNDPGSWTIKSTGKEPCPFRAGDGIIVYKNGEYYYSGILKQISETYDGYDRLYSWTVTGAGDLELLKRRVCYVDPETGDTDEYSYYTDTGKLTDVVKRIIDKNLGVDALESRKDVWVAETPSESAGEVVSVSLRYQTILKAITPLLEAQGYSIAPYWDGQSRKLIFRMRASTDLSSFLLFTTDMGAITEVTYLAEAPGGNYIISGGQGELTERAFAYAHDDESISEWGRIEYFRDMRSVDVGELQSDADTTLAKEASENVGYSAKLNTDAIFLQYRSDWNLGDYVGVVVHGKTFVRRVMQVETEMSYDEVTVTPTIGTAEQGQFAGIFKELRYIRSDVDQIQQSIS